MKNLLLLFFIAGTTSLWAQKMPFTLLPSGHILVEAEIEGKKGKFIFDTGAGINLFFKKFAQQLNQKESHNFLAAYRATGEKIEASLFNSHKIVFNNKTFENIPYTTFDLNLEGIDGLIALPMLGDTEFIIDYNKKEIIFPAEKLNSSKAIDIQLTTHADKTLDISTYIYLNNHIKINVMLDSGAGSNSF